MPPPPRLETQCRAVSTPSSTLSRTSNNIKMEREKQRLSRLAGRPHLALLPSVTSLAHDRDKFFGEARQRFHNTNGELFAAFLAEREERFLGRLPPAFPGEGGATVASQLAEGEEGRNSDRGEGRSSDSGEGRNSDGGEGRNFEGRSSEGRISEEKNSEMIGDRRPSEPSSQENIVDVSTSDPKSEPICEATNSEGMISERIIPITISLLPASPLTSPPPLTPPEEGTGGGRIIPVMMEPSTPVVPALPTQMGDL